MKGFSRGGSLIIIGALVLFFIGGYVCLFGGISQIINGFGADPVSIGAIVEGAAKIIFAGFVAICASAVIIIGILIR